ncbi:serine hydrolase [Streptomyces collinus]|uniref:serine hydrolase n=1 Tax=Streptomyces collinus TaxID=42684 RepID=UPI00368F4CE9
MPTLRALLSLPLLALLLTPATATGHASGVTDPVLPLPVEGGAAAAALPARDGDRTRYAAAGRGIARADHFRAGSVTESCVATVVLQLADEHRLSLSDTVERYLPGLLRGPGTDGRRITLSALLTHTSGLADFTRSTHGAVPLTPFQAPRIALTLPPAGGTTTASPGSYVRTAATVDGRRVLTFRVDTTEFSDPGLEPRLLAAGFCPRIRWNGRHPTGDPGRRHPIE